MIFNTKPRLTYGLIFAVPLFVSLILAIYFLLECQKQIEYSSRLQILYVPLVLASIDNWVVFVLICFGFVCIILPKGPPVIAFGVSVLIVFPSIFSTFTGIEIYFSANRYKSEIGFGLFEINTTYQRLLTQSLLKALDNFYHKEFECCGLNNYKDYCLNHTVVNATGDNQHEVNKHQRFTLYSYDYLRGINKHDLMYSDYKAIRKGEDLPRSCALKFNSSVNSTCNSTSVKDKQFLKGCRKEILQPFDHCLNVILISVVAPWVVFLYAIAFSWAHLRQSQGLKFFQIRSPKRVHPSEDDPEAGTDLSKMVKTDNATKKKSTSKEGIPTLRSTSPDNATIDISLKSEKPGRRRTDNSDGETK